MHDIHTYYLLYMYMFNTIVKITNIFKQLKKYEELHAQTLYGGVN